MQITIISENVYFATMKIVLLFLLSASSVWAVPKGGRIVGGQTAYDAEFPYAVAITKSTPDGNFFCTGSLLSPEWVITAGQCVNDADSLSLVLGSSRLNGDSQWSQTVETDLYVLHPEFEAANLRNDIALIQLAEPVELSTYVNVLHLPDEQYENAVGIAYGWGQVSDDNPDFSEVLQYATLYSVDAADCRETYGDQLQENMVCFKASDNGGTCLGDGGSPIIKHTNRGYTVVIAISAFVSANGCQSADPNGFTDVFPYNDWIKNVTGLA